MIGVMLLFAAVTTCNPDAVAATLSQAQAINDDAVAKTRRLDEVRAMLAQDESIIRQERANPGGVVDMRALHELGRDVQAERATVVQLTSEIRAELRLASRVTAVAAQLMQPCPRDMTVTLARLPTSDETFRAQFTKAP